MGRLTFEISMSLDGYIAGPDATLEQPLGDGGERLHEWISPRASSMEPTRVVESPRVTHVRYRVVR